MTVALASCSNYIKRDEFDSTVAELRAARPAAAIAVGWAFAEARRIGPATAGRTRVETGAHFATGDATLSEQDKPLLDDFARVIRSSYTDALITVEGFTDPAGSTAFNKRLGQRRADAIRDYLVSSGGLAAQQVRAVSYGEEKNRLVRPGAKGEEGRDNRRVALVVDYAGPMSAATASR